jgi:hypothetical protein
VGNDECVDCHKKDDMHPDHVKRWSNTKFKTFERIQKEPDYQAGGEDYKKQCYKCHTTGYREDKGIYAAEGVGCEACHGPGEVYAYLMQGVRDEEYDIEQGQKLAKISFDFSICGNCHIPKRHEMREEFLKEKAKEEAKAATAKEAAAAAAAAKEAAAEAATAKAAETVEGGHPKAGEPKTEHPE